MKTLLQRITKKILASGLICPADVTQLLTYNARHPMWRIGADDRTLAAYDAIITQAKKAAA